MTDKERRIREVAHQIWEDEGRPADQAERHWEMAQRIVEATGPEDSEPTLVPGADPKGAASTSGGRGHDHQWDGSDCVDWSRTRSSRGREARAAGKVEAPQVNTL
jgi:Protein of unknown function (DUF2934)